VIVKARAGYRAYGEMLLYYAVTNLLAYLQARPKATRATMCEELSGPRAPEWVNLGGQLVRGDDLERLLADVRSGRLGTWGEVHGAYDRLWEAYPLAKQRHALATLVDLLEAEQLSDVAWQAALARAVEIQEYVARQVFLSRKKDFDSPFRRITFRNADEMTAVLGTAEGNSFVKQVAEETVRFRELVAEVRRRETSGL
jgi:hypothetical protein